MNRFLLIVGFMLILSSQLLRTQAQQAQFTKVFQDENYQWTGLVANCIDRSYDGNYIVAGSYGLLGMFLEMDGSGNVLLSKHAGGYYQGSFECMSKTSDSCYVFVATFDYDINCVKTNQTGDTVWTSSVSTNDVLSLGDIVETSDNGFVVTGYFHSGVDFDHSIFVFKLDSLGHLIWSRYYYNPFSIDLQNFAHAVVQTPDSGFVVTGNDSSLLLLLKVTKDGEIAWPKVYSDTSLGYCTGLSTVVMPDGLVTLFHFVKDYMESGFGLFKTDFSGNPVWCRRYTSSFYVTSGSPTPSVILHHDGNGHFYFISEHFDSNILIVTDTSGNLESVKGYTLRTSDVIKASDGGYVIIGYGPLDSYLYTGVIKTDSLGNTVNCTSPAFVQTDDCILTLEDRFYLSSAYGEWNVHPVSFYDFPVAELEGCVENYYVSIDQLSGQRELVIYPNPTSGMAIISIKPETSENIYRIEIFNSSGHQIIRSSDPVSQIDLSSFPNGLYLVKVETTEGTVTQRLILQH